MPNTLWLWVFRALSSQGIISQRLRGGLLSNDKSRALNLSSQPFMVVGGGLFLATSNLTWFVRNDPGSLRNWHVFQLSDFKHTRQLYLGYKQSWLIQLWIRFALIVFARRHRVLVKHHFSQSDWFSWTPLNSTVVPMTQQRRKWNNETTKSSSSIFFTRCLLLS